MPDTSLDEDLPEALRGDTKVIRVGASEFHMTTVEWEQVKTWIAERQQERAMRWWAEQFEMPFAQAVGIINRVQVAIQYAGLT